MAEMLFDKFALFSIEAVVFAVLGFILFMYYRGFGRQYVAFWMLSLVSLSVNQLFLAVKVFTSGQRITSSWQLFYEIMAQVSNYLHLALLLLGIFAAIKQRDVSKKWLTICLSASIVIALLASLLFTTDEATVFNRFYLRESLSAFIYGCCLLGVSCYLLVRQTLYFSGKVLMFYSFIVGLRFILFSFISIVTITEVWFPTFTELLIFFDAGAKTILGFIMLVWMQGAERHLATSAISRMNYLGKHDPLTGVLNREQVLEKLPVIMKNAADQQQSLFVYLLDIKRFKFINDTYGLKVGDLVLGEIANRLSKSILMPKIVGRLSGDSFIFVIELADILQQERAAEHIHGLIGSPYQIHQQEVHLQCSLGYCIYPTDGEKAEELMQQANLALFHAETHKIATVKYEVGMQSQGRHLIAMEKDIRRGLAAEEFILYFQPQLNLITNRLEGVEALIRWQHPEKGLLAPGYFLDDVAALGLNRDIDNYVLDKACRTIASWYQTYKRRISIAVNITAVEFQDPLFVDKIQKLLLAYKIPPSYLELEITENVLITEVSLAMKTIVVLQNMGIKVSIDDFGTGYSSLAYLRELPIDKIKIDRSFIKEVASNDSDLTIVKSMIKLSHGLGKRVLAEGVETAEQLKVLRNLHCDAVQGFFISKPLPESEFAMYLTRK